MTVNGRAGYYFVASSQQENEANQTAFANTAGQYAKSLYNSLNQQYQTKLYHAMQLVSKLPCLSGESATDCVGRREAAAEQLADNPNISDNDITSGKAISNVTPTSAEKNLINKNGGSTVRSSTQPIQQKDADGIWQSGLDTQKATAYATVDPTVRAALTGSVTASEQYQSAQAGVRNAQQAVQAAQQNVQAAQENVDQTRKTDRVPSYTKNLSPDEQKDLVAPIVKANDNLGNAYNNQDAAQKKLQDDQKTVDSYGPQHSGNQNELTAAEKIANNNNNGNNGDNNNSDNNNSDNNNSNNGNGGDKSGTPTPAPTPTSTPTPSSNSNSTNSANSNDSNSSSSSAPDIAKPGPR